MKSDYTINSRYIRFLKGWENTFFELRSGRVKNEIKLCSMFINITKEYKLAGWLCLFPFDFPEIYFERN